LATSAIMEKKSTKPPTVPERAAQATAADAEAAPIVVVDPTVWTREMTLLQYSLTPKTGDGDSAYNSDEMFLFPLSRYQHC
jgi:hypothetical protein